ncbi:uncharacterized protein EAE97_004769 [Botrytis byssoidea]|uniref:non-specific serine/threonine protein kinase n=1 Tax=Botrytis byssoidea TaxID=139641 RepID=A0A9P5IQS3_9HELO|nr:uncharacterized protein EAE97_004769 [Botrytis byssoidea]KAF7945731.1 hypothetical protein EAE97_004769 [Botrytis byssoidea]
MQQEQKPKPKPLLSYPHLSRLFIIGNKLNYCYLYLSLIVTIYTRLLENNTSLSGGPRLPPQIILLLGTLQEISRRFFKAIGLWSNPAAVPPPLPPPLPPANPPDPDPPSSDDEASDSSHHSSQDTPSQSSSDSNAESIYAPTSPPQNSSLSQRDIHESEERLAHYYQSLKKEPKSIRRNKWREDPRLGRLENQVFEGILGVGGFGSGWIGKEKFSSFDLVLNTLTQKRYALKLQSETTDQRLSRRKREQPPTPHTPPDPLSHTPPITPSSEATITSPTLIGARNLLSKRYRENRCYLQYIKSGHPNICALDAFLDFTSQFGAAEERGIVMFASYYEYCDGGDLFRILSGYRKRHQRIASARKRSEMVNLVNMGRHMRREPLLPFPPEAERRFPPELFLWHIFSQLISAILFLHNEHPDYNTLPEHRNRAMVITMDLAPQNVFLQWPDYASTPEQRRAVYPDIKVGDFGTANFLPPGGRIPAEEGVEAETPDQEYYDARTDVWTVGLMIYQFATRAQAGEQKDDIEGMYSAQLNKVVKAAMKKNREERIEGKKLGRILQSGYEKRIPHMFKELPDWAISQEDVLKYRFSERHVKELWERDWNLKIEQEEEEEAKAAEDEDRDLHLMLLVKERKLRFGIELDEDEEDDEAHLAWIQALKDEKPELYAELLAEAREKVPSPEVPDSGESEEDLG